MNVCEESEDPMFSARQGRKERTMCGQPIKAVGSCPEFGEPKESAVRLAEIEQCLRRV